MRISRPDAVFQRRDDFAARGVVLGIGAEHDRDVERQADRVSLNLHVAFLHDVEQADLNLAREVGQFVDGEDSAIGARQQAVVHGEFAGEFVPSARGFDGIDVADQVGDRHVGRGQFFHVAMVGREPGNRRGVPFFGNQLAAAAADRSVGIVVNLAARDVRHLRIEQRRQRAQNAALRLSAQAEQNEVVAREDGVHDLRALPCRRSRRCPERSGSPPAARHQVLAQLVFYPPRHRGAFRERTLAQLAQMSGQHSWREPLEPELPAWTGGKALGGLYARRAPGSKLSSSSAQSSSKLS